MVTKDGGRRGKWSYCLRCGCGFVSQGSKRYEWAKMEAGEEKLRRSADRWNDAFRVRERGVPSS
jgi:hypothetical protein